ncbi:hypothetical protein E1A91_A02G121000v1 [Gossypium mustelinum]|uniref:Uncharacterized protein n=1 Tax=Gossypium mustelinum TaxID=34275 RepID=A0A5D3A6D3_GOSMU|nr:hypothetical protein E1A91_A02G121000v1 [Gossypium mustelinum]
MLVFSVQSLRELVSYTGELFWKNTLIGGHSTKR